MMTRLKDEFPALLRVLAGAIESLSPSEYDNLVRGKGSLVYWAKSPTPELNKHDISPELGALSERLLHLESREEARDLLKSSPHLKTKRDFEFLARLLDVYTAKSDTTERLVERLVESSVGTKLRSQAIKRIRLDSSIPEEQEVPGD